MTNMDPNNPDDRPRWVKTATTWVPAVVAIALLIGIIFFYNVS
jgi:hypothetical protein